jgi:hypothetical protein
MVLGFGSGYCAMSSNATVLQVAEEVMADVSAKQLYGSAPLVTELVPASRFWVAEKYHQRYYANNPSQGAPIALGLEPLGRSPVDRPVLALPCHAARATSCHRGNPSPRFLTAGYCAYVVGPKVAKFRAKWKHLLIA